MDSANLCKGVTIFPVPGLIVYKEQKFMWTTEIPKVLQEVDSSEQYTYMDTSLPIIMMLLLKV